MLLDDFNLAALFGLGATSVGVIADMMRVIFFFLDSIVYSLIPVVYRGIFALYDIDKIIGVGNTQNLLNTAKETVYSFLAIFMFFRVAFSLITMLVDPSLIDDKSKGAKKIVLNIFICLGLIVVVPVFFRVAKNIQTRVLEEKIIERAVGGDIYSNDQNYNLGNELALSTWSVFLQPVVDEGDAYDAWKGVFESGNPTIWPLPVLATHLNDTTGGILGGLATKIAGVAAILRATGTVTYQLGYIWLISGLVGIYVVWTMIKLLIDVAYRSIKFLLLEVISPIAIISYIDPKSSEKGLFSKWLSETLKTYLSLFIRIFIFAMVSVILKQISVSSFFDEGNILTRLFFILALVAFMKTAPKFIDNLFGTEISKGSDAKFGSDLLKQGLGFVTGAAIGGISGGVVAKRTGQPVFKNIMKNAWQGGQKVSGAAKKGGLGGLTGVISSGFGTVADVKKGLGYNVDKDQEKLIDNLEENVVPKAEQAKKAASSSFADGSKINSILNEGRKVNGRTYGMGLEGDDKFKNAIIKNAAGLAADEVKHSDDEEYLKYRRLVADAKITDAMASRSYELAKEKYEHDESEYVGAKNKASYVISLANDVAKKEYGQMDAASIQAEFTRQLENYKNTARSSFQSSNRTSQIELIVGAGVDRTQAEQMNETQLSSAYDVVLDTISNNRTTAFNNGSASDKVNLTVDLKTSNVSHEVAGASERDLGIMFSELNEKNIIATFGNSLGNMAADSGKAAGDVKTAEDVLDKYLNSGKGKKAKDIDTAYKIAKGNFDANKLKNDNQSS